MFQTFFFSQRSKTPYGHILFGQNRIPKNLESTIADWAKIANLSKLGKIVEKKKPKNSKKDNLGYFGENSTVKW